MPCYHYEHSRFFFILPIYPMPDATSCFCFEFKIHWNKNVLKIKSSSKLLGLPLLLLFVYVTLFSEIINWKTFHIFIARNCVSISCDTYWNKMHQLSLLPVREEQSSQVSIFYISGAPVKKAGLYKQPLSYLLKWVVKCT